MIERACRDHPAALGPSRGSSPTRGSRSSARVPGFEAIQAGALPAELVGGG